jgi:hypothetical protein
MTNKARTLHTFIGGCLAAALPCLALASPPSDAAVGQIDAILDFCTKAVPALEEGAHDYRTLLTGNAARGARNSSAYRQGYEQVSEALQKGNHGQEVAACVAGLKEHKDRDDGHRHKAPPGHGVLKGRR